MKWLLGCMLVIIAVSGVQAYLRPDFVIDAANLIATCF